MKKLNKALLAGLALSSGLVIGCSSNESIDENTTGVTYYASPTGEAGAKGTKSKPLEVYEAFSKLKAGDTLILLEGVYNTPNRFFIDRDDQSGLPGKPITVKNEEGKKVEFDFRDQEISDASRGIQLNGNYWHIYGLNVRGAGDNGIYVGGSYNIIESCVTYENQDTGIQIGRAYGNDDNIALWPHNNLIKNCTSFNNYDYKSFGENADGFAAKLTTGEGNVFDGCIAYRNADDGWDLYAKSDTGNVGTTVIKNCLAFENGWMLNKVPVSEKTDLDQYGKTKISTTRKMQEKAGVAYTTRDGDGIGFKLGGSVMEGNVIVENCLSFNNRLHGFSDNSNPGVLSLRNCTAFNNSMAPNADTGLPMGSDVNNRSNNIDTARSETSYNNYYGILSYMTNQTNPQHSYTNKDMFKGSASYSIFNMGKNKYTSIKDAMDANSYNSTQIGRAYNDLNDSNFEAVALGFDITPEVDVHRKLRNTDDSINVGNMMKIKSEELLKFCDGNQIGANLSEGSWTEYDHYSFSDYLGVEKESDDSILEGARDALEVMCNPNAVYQDVLLLTTINDCKVEWQSSNDQYFQVGRKRDAYTNEFIVHSSNSGLKYIDGVVLRQRDADKEVTLTATISKGEKSLTKTFKLVIKKDVLVLGDVVGFDSRYILTSFSDFEIPTPQVLNATSYAGNKLIEGTDYEYKTHIEYAATTKDFTDGNFYEISKVYSSVPGVYKVVYDIKSLFSDETKEVSFFVYVVSETAKIDVETSSLNVSRDGVIVEAKLTNILGDLYVLASSESSVTAEELIKNGKRFDITDETVRAIYEIDNDHAYNVFYMVTNKKNTYQTEILKAEVKVENVSTIAEFNKVLTATDKATIFMLQNDLDFTNVEFKSQTGSFGALFNGNGYTIKNVNVQGTAVKANGIFNQVKNGTIMNVNFENINIEGYKDEKGQDAATIAGIVGQMTGGYIHNIGLKNISVHAQTGVGAMVGQITGGYNYVSQVSLVNDKDHNLTVSNKYVGGIVGNVQKDSNETLCHAEIINCYVSGVVGDGQDSGGYIGGIVGRAKNDYDVCSLTIEKCYFTGQVRTGKNYVAGILAGTDNGAGHVFLYNNITSCTIYFAGTVLDGLSSTTMSSKNASTIIGRMTVGLGEYKSFENYATFEDSHIYTETEGVAEDIYTSLFWKISMGFDLENIWVFDETTNTISLRTPTHN